MGWLKPRDAPFTVVGFAPTLFVIAAGFVLLGLFRSWQRRRESRGTDPLVRFSLLELPPLRAGLAMLLAQNLVLLGLFFTIPLYLQIVLGLDAFQTGVRLLPVSVAMFITAMAGPALGRFASPRGIVRAGVVILLVAVGWLLSTVEPTLHNLSFGLAMAVLGIGMGLLASQLGNVVQSSVGESERSEVGGLQYTAQNLGSSLGTALIGAIVLAALTGAFTKQISNDPNISAAVQQQASVAVENGINFVSTDQISSGLAQNAVPPDQAQAIVDNYSAAQLFGLKTGLLAAAGLALASLPFTRNLPGSGPGEGTRRRRQLT